MNKSSAAKSSDTRMCVSERSSLAKISPKIGIVLMIMGLFLALSSVQGFAQVTTHGMTIPATHPRLWPFSTSALKTQVQTWRAANPSYGSWTCSIPPSGAGDYLCMAFDHQALGHDCSTAVTWAVNNNQNNIVNGWPIVAAHTDPTYTGGPDDVRTAVPYPVRVYDWCFDQFSTTDYSSTLTAAITTTTAQTIAVASTTNAYVNQELTIGSDNVWVNTVVDSTHLAITAPASTHSSSTAVTGLSQQHQFVTTMNTWMSAWDQQCWGGVIGGTQSCGITMDSSNYFFGRMQNDFEYGIATIGDPDAGGSGGTADGFIGFGIDTRWAAIVADPFFSGGVLGEGSEYAAQYWTLYLPFATMKALGRDLASEFFNKSNIFEIYQSTTPEATNDIIVSSPPFVAFQLYSFSDDEITANGGMYAARSYLQNYLNWASNEWATTGNVGKNARLLYNTVMADPNNFRGPDPWVMAADNSPTASTDFSNLPVDWYASGPHYAFVSKTASSSTATRTFLQMGLGFFCNTANGFCRGGHLHFDLGNFSVWRAGRWVARETTDYGSSGTTITGTPGISATAGGVDVSAILGHNTLAFTNAALGQDSGSNLMMPTVLGGDSTMYRMESQAGYFFADADNTPMYLWEWDHTGLNLGTVGHVERAFIYVRSLDTWIIYDVLLTGNQVHGSGCSGTCTASQVATSFLLHSETNPTVEDSNHFTNTNGTQVARLTTLLPASATSRVVNENSCTGCGEVSGNPTPQGQFRIESDATGAAQRYHLNVIQFRTTSDSNLTASVSDSNASDPTSGTFTVTLAPSVGSATVITLPKAACTADTYSGTSVVTSNCFQGGTINIAGAGATSLATTVEPVAFNDTAGEVFNPPPACSVSITSPIGGATVGGTISVSGTAAPGSGASTVTTQFTLDGVNLGTAQSGTSPSVSWATTGSTNGSHTLGATCSDNNGGGGSAPVSVTVSNGATAGGSKRGGKLVLGGKAVRGL